MHLLVGDSQRFDDLRVFVSDLQRGQGQNEWGEVHDPRDRLIGVSFGDANGSPGRSSPANDREECTEKGAPDSPSRNGDSLHTHRSVFAPSNSTLTDFCRETRIFACGSAPSSGLRENAVR